MIKSLHSLVFAFRVCLCVSFPLIPVPRKKRQFPESPDGQLRQLGPKKRGWGFAGLQKAKKTFYIGGKGAGREGKSCSDALEVFITGGGGL